jgi:hypothetical protein
VLTEKFNLRLIITVNECGSHYFFQVKPLVLFPFYRHIAPETGGGYGKDKNHQ